MKILKYLTAPFRWYYHLIVEGSEFQVGLTFILTVLVTLTLLFYFGQ